MSTDLSNFKKLYFETAHVYVLSMQKALENAAPNSEPHVFENLHLYAHSLKSQSAVMQYTQIAELSGYLEQIFNKLIIHTEGYSLELSGVIKASVTSLKNALTNLEKDQETEASLSDRINDLRKFI